MTPTCYLLCNNDRLMPAQVAGITDNGMVEVTSPDGRSYTAAPQNIVNLEDAAHMLRIRRADKLISQGYVVCQIAEYSFRVWSPEKHGEYGGYIVNDFGNGHTCCTCPDAAKGNECKHILGLAELMRRARVKLTVRVPARIVDIAA